MTMPYNPHGNSICERFNHTLLDLIKTFPKEQQVNCPLHVPSLVFVYKVMPQSITGFHPYKPMFWCKAPTVFDAWLGLTKALTSKCAWLHEQHQLLMSANRQALKNIRQSIKKSQTRAGGKTLHIAIGNLVLLTDHPEG